MRIWRRLHFALAFWLSFCPDGKAADPDRGRAQAVQALFAQKCLECHGPDDRKGGLRLDRREDALKALRSGAHAFVPGRPEAGELLTRVKSSDPDQQMPPKGERLSREEIALLRTWIAEGAPYAPHWAYTPLRLEPPPAVADPGWVRSPIDAWVLARLEREGLVPSPEAGRATLIRRLFYDLVGLPPTPGQVDAFVADASPGAYEKVVDELLRSRHFGERWGRHWLDMARYADSDGYEKDNPRPDAWHYRDWVIEAVNADLPFDQFTREQLAGDLLPGPGDHQQVATAFHRQTLTNTEGGADQEQFRNEAVFDRVETTGAIWLGLTVGCARCHSHKYDAVSHREYFQLFAFYDNADEATHRLTVPAAEMAAYQETKAMHAARLESVRSRLVEAEEAGKGPLAAWKESLDALPVEARPKELAAVLAVPLEKRSTAQNKQVRDHFFAQIHEPTKEPWASLKKLEKSAPPEPGQIVRVLAQRMKEPRATRLLERGDFLSPGVPVVPGGLEILPPVVFRSPGQADRLDLANWLMDERNPLTPRVLANHVWMHLFGEGLVRTANDFGVRGEPPSHPGLLDWLASEYRRLGWSRKAMIRTIVLSSTYRQSSRHRAELLDLDPSNRLLARQNRLRVEAELVRDIALSISGLLSEKVGGPSVFPPMPADIAALSYANNFKWTESPGEDRYRRGLYTFFKRSSPHPNLLAFDCPDANTTSVGRRVSNTPLQALALLNNETFAEAAEAFAKRALGWETSGDGARVALLLRHCVAREPAAEETSRFLELLRTARAYYEEHAGDAERLTKRHRAPGVPASEAAAWTSVARIALNLDEVITRE